MATLGTRLYTFFKGRPVGQDGYGNKYYEAKSELTAAGFRLDAEGDLLHNPADNRAGSNSESGHFVTDRFMLRMKRP